MKEVFNSLRLDADIARTQVGSTLIVLSRDGTIADPLDGLQEFAQLVVKVCVDILKETAEDVDNGDIFSDQELLNRFEERWSAGLYYGIEQIEERLLK